MNAIDFLVRKDQFTITELRETPAPALEDGQVRLGVDKFALTANNITYAAFGEAMSDCPTDSLRCSSDGSYFFF